MPFLVSRRDKTFSEADFPPEPSCDPLDAPYASAAEWFSNTTICEAPQGFVRHQGAEGSLPLLSMNPSRPRRRKAKAAAGGKQDEQAGDGAVAVASTAAAASNTTNRSAAAVAAAAAAASSSDDDSEALREYAEKQSEFSMRFR